MGMLSLKLLRYSASIVAALVLTACGGGGGASDTNITETDAYEAVTVAKSAEVVLREQVIAATEFVEDLAKYTDPATTSTGSVYSNPVTFTTTICSTSGSVQKSYKKVTQKTGLTVGDSFKMVFNNCVKNGYKVTGTVVLTALTTTSADVSSATNSIALPMSIDFQSLSSEQLPVVGNSSINNTKETYTGTLSFTTLNYNFSPTSTGIATSSSFTYSFQDFTESTTVTVNFSALSANASISSAGTVTGTFTANISGSLTGISPGSTTMTLAASTTSPITLGDDEPTAATYTITNFQGGKVVGTLPSGDTDITITVDNGNNGSIENTYIRPFDNIDPASAI